MANFQAIATVTAALRARLMETLITDVPAAAVSTLTPAAPSAAGIPDIGVNIFLFAIHIDPAQRNRDLPLRRASGDQIGTPVIPLTLDYLFSFYGDANGAAQQIAGSVMRSLYARPILTGTMITTAEGTAGLNSQLAAQADPVRFTPLPLPIEEMSKIWSVFFQTSYALSVAFRAGPVLIEADIPLLSGPPVATPVVVVAALLQPSISAIIASGALATAPITAGAAIDILGVELAGDVTTVVIGGIAVTPSFLSAEKLTATMPAGLAAGRQALEIRQDITLPGGAGVRPGALSPAFSFTLSPMVAQTADGYSITLSDLSGSGTAPRSATVSVGVVPDVQAGQITQLQLLDLSLNPVAVFAEETRTTSASSLLYSVAAIAAGTYVLRVSVDGAVTQQEAGQALPQVVFT